VDNGSTDETAREAGAFPVTLLHETTPGIIAARRAGFDACSCEVIARTDADTEVPSTWVANIRAAFTAHPDWLALSGPVRYRLGPFRRIEFMYPGNSLYMRAVRCWPTLVGPNMVITRRTWLLVRDKVQADDGQVHEDMDLSLCVTQHGLIGFDRRVETFTSARRVVEHPASFLANYPLRNFRTLLVHGGVRSWRARAPKSTPAPADRSNALQTTDAQPDGSALAGTAEPRG
jgi:glycosyltransferase involved in cell wall biosynthesis